MHFTPAPLADYGDIPIAYVLDLGVEEFLGLRDENGDFRQLTSLREIPISYWQEVEMFGPSLGLLKPCTASILMNEESVGSMTIGVIDGHPACVAITSSTHGLTGALLRQIPIASLVRDAASTSTVRVLSTESGAVFGARYVDGGPGFGQLLTDLRSELAAVEDNSRRRVISRAFLAEVALIYRDAVAMNKAPAKAVQMALGPTTPENARRWIASARREGLLGPALGPGRKGEII